MYKVVLIDDEPWALYSLENGVEWEKRGFEVIGKAYNGEDGLAIIRKENPDVIFTDIRMDDISGIELLQKARKENITAEFVIVSAYGEFSYAKDAIQCALFDYILKPVEEAEVNNLLARLSRKLKEKRYTAEQIKLVIPEGERKDYEYANQNFVELLHYVDEHFREDFTLEELSAKFYLNNSYTCTLFKKITGDTFSVYLNNLRMKEAHYLLLTTDYSTAKVAELSGYRDYYYFCKAFKRKFGITPRQCRLEGRGGNENKA